MRILRLKVKRVIFSLAEWRAEQHPAGAKSPFVPEKSRESTVQAHNPILGQDSKFFQGRKRQLEEERRHLRPIPPVPT